ncbi:outer membrane beta-barrel protein [Pyxidicoccus trucidator]|uniref:outer membrane beta-barrel protein n=1 Tax=Pyxidicoccus trucidator TaxID=2709662 RepID=UPI0013DA82A0|nr:outer membrane beta-barrel protein [Pyxidicoccus trucidator]
MNTSTFKKLTALSLLLSSPAALADWRNDGFLRQEDDPSYNEGYEGADEDSEEGGQGAGFVLGLRAGYGVPFGNAVGTEDEDDEGAKLSDTVSGVIPLQVDLGYFINSNLYLGASFQYGLGQFAEDCDGDFDDASCGVTQLRVGLNLAYHFSPSATLSPWLGVGVGYEHLSLNVSGEAAGTSIDASTTASGFEFVNAQGGVDFRVSDKISVGPFATLTVAQYSTSGVKLDVEGDSPLDFDESEDIENKAIHAWLYGGVRMQVRF